MSKSYLGVSVSCGRKILSRFDGCWRWLLDREDSPWYPTARLFRQKTAGDWDEVIRRVAGELARIAQPARDMA